MSESGTKTKKAVIVFSSKMSRTVNEKAVMNSIHSNIRVYVITYSKKLNSKYIGLSIVRTKLLVFLYICF